MSARKMLFDVRVHKKSLLFHTWEHMAFIINHNSFAVFFFALFMLCSDELNACIHWFCMLRESLNFFSILCSFMQTAFPWPLKVMQKLHRSARCASIIISKAQIQMESKHFEYRVPFKVREWEHYTIPSSYIFLKCTKWQRRADTALPVLTKSIRINLTRRHVFASKGRTFFIPIEIGAERETSRDGKMFS